MEHMEQDWQEFTEHQGETMSAERSNQMLKVILGGQGHKVENVVELRSWFLRSAAVWLLLLVSVALGVLYRSHQTREIIYDYAQSRKIKLPDGTLVHLRGNSRLAYQETFWGDQRRVNLSGEGFFDVYPNKNQPFIITTTHGSVRVVGTCFNLRQYQDGMWVAVSEGKVMLSNPAGKTISLVKNQLGQVFESGALSRENTEVVNYGSWQQGHPLYFNNMPLPAVCRQLERMYGVRIELPEALNNKRLTASSHYDTLPNILDKLALSLDIHYQIKDGDVIIKTN